MSTFPTAAQERTEEEKPFGWTPDLMLQVKRVGSVQVSPDGAQVAYTVREAVTWKDTSEYRTHIHVSNSVGGTGWQLTQGDKSCDDPQWSPNGEWIAFVSGRGGKKNLWLIRANGGEATQVTESKTDVSSFKWSPDGKFIAFTAADAPTGWDESRIQSKFDARVVDDNFKLNRLFLTPVFDLPESPRYPRQLTTANLQHVVGESGRPGRPAFDWAPDGKTIVFAHTRTPTQDDWTSSDLSLLDVESGKVRPLLNSPAVEASPLYSPDGKSIAYLQSDNPPTWGGTRTVHVMGADGTGARQLADTMDGFGRYSELIGWSKDGRQLYFTEVQGTALKIMSLPLDGPPVAINKNDGMSLGGVFLNASRTHFGFGWEQLNQPCEAYLSPVEKFEPVVVSRIHQNLQHMPRCKTEIIRWKSTEGLEIEGLLTYPMGPQGYDKSKKYPLVVVIHGGPMGVFTQTFDANAATYPVAAFASKGYAVLRANVRGSSGYGKKFRYANYEDWGGGDFRDLMAGVDHVIGMGVADPERMGVMGWSYGGYLTSWTITQTKRFKAASVGAGVTNLVSFTGTADIPGFLPDYFHGEFWDKLDTYRKHSPMFHIKGVTTPTLIQHGDKDERVPLSQGQELYNALKRQGCVTKMIVYPRTPHGIEEPRLLQDSMNRNLDWFDEYLGAPSRTAASPKP
ncbi:MAG: putative secreted peptidase [Planctomycetaceae bacterium]|nr:putative secreted peptidase [Planctomycetaceae bacterium]